MKKIHIDITLMVSSIILAIIIKVMQGIIGDNTLFAILSLLSLILFAISVIGFIEDKYSVKIINIGRKTM